MTPVALSSGAGCRDRRNSDLAAPTPPLLTMDPHALVSRSWNGTPIARRTSDGNVNATTMGKANGKQWNDYWRTDRDTTDLETLGAETGSPVSTLCLSLKGGARQGTWVHPQVAVELARWISAPFAVGMDSWFLEGIQQAAPAPVETTPPRRRDVEVIALGERSIGLFERLGGLDQCDQLLFKDIVRSSVLSASSEQALLPAFVADGELTLGDAWLEVFQRVLPRSQSCSAGKVVAKAYREEFGRQPLSRQQYADGAPRQVGSYRRSWLIETLQRLRTQLEGS